MSRRPRSSPVLRATAMAAALLIAPRFGSTLAAQDLGIAVGAPAPAFTIEALDGTRVDVGQYIGKTPILIEFWATWCPNCKALEPSLLAAQKQYGNQVKFIGVAVSVNESVDLVKKYVGKHGIRHQILYDRAGDASEAYDVPATSYIVVIDKTGKVAYTGLGSEQNIDAAVRKAM